MKRSAKISLIILSVVVAIVGLAIGTLFLLISPNVNIIGAPDLDLFALASDNNTLKILDRDGQPICDTLFYGNKTSVDIDDIGKHTKNAFIAVEDKRFYSHGGIDYKRIASAAVSNIKSQSLREGASTITQQLIKNTHLSNEKTFKRKLSEMRLARQLEKEFDKDSILESYFNILYFGSGIRGLGTASRVLFEKPASELSIAQSAALASIINNPTKYSPYNNPENLEDRKNLVLRLMNEQKFITDEEYAAALAEKLVYGRSKKNGRYIDTVIKIACDKLDCTEKELFSGHYTIYGGSDSKLSAKVRDIVESYDDFNGHIRVLVLDNKSGAVMCDEDDRGGTAEIRRSPASTIKPFVSYAPAIEGGLNPLSQILDEPTDFNGYAPSNYKDVYRGWQSLEDCLIYSSNVAAVKLLSNVGIDGGVSSARAFGLNVSDEDKNLSLALGGMTSGLTLGEIANAYRTLANGGMFSEISYIDKVTDANGLNVYRSESQTSRRAVREDTAYLLTDILSSCAKNGTAKKLGGIDNIAAKTGTNGDGDGNYDCYCIAYTPLVTVAVWFGADDSPIDNSVTGASCCAIIKKLCDDGYISDDEEFVMPSSVGYYEIDDKELRTTHELYLADPLLPKRYRRRALLSKNNLPIRKNVGYIDYFDEYDWSNMFKNSFDFFGYSSR